MKQVSGTVRWFDLVRKRGAIRPHGRGLPETVIFHLADGRPLVLNGNKKMTFLPQQQANGTPQAGDQLGFLLPEECQSASVMETTRWGFLPRRRAKANADAPKQRSKRKNKKERRLIDRHLQLRNH